LIWAAVQICSRDFGLAGWIAASKAGYVLAPGAFRELMNGRLTPQGAELVSAESCVRPKAGGTGKYCAVKDGKGNVANIADLQIGTGF
jgi:hypothetical protein